MVTPGRERIAKLRGIRDGRTLSVWLYADETRMFNNIKNLTGDTNDDIIKDAIQDLYKKTFSDKCSELIKEIRSKHKKPRPSKAELHMRYLQLIRVLKLEYPTADRLKKEMNRLGVPNYSGKTGTWKIAQVRKLL